MMMMMGFGRGCWGGFVRVGRGGWGVGFGFGFECLCLSLYLLLGGSWDFVDLSWW